MFPMVSGVDEIRQAREEVELCIDQLAREGRRHHGSPRIGAMVELPAAVISIEELASETDFLSVGTNDLTMYLLAVDRTNDRLSELYRSHHPVVLRTLADIARRVDDGLSNLSVCGEAAADPLMVPFFLGIGVRKLSVAPRQIPHVRSTAARYDRETAGTYAENVLAIRSLSEMDGFLKAYRHPDVPPEVPPRHR
jgi:phosphotransferase system, enzyme I, PtsP